MGIMTELYLAPADAVGAAVQPPGEDGVALGGLTSLELSTLWVAVEGAEWDVERHGLELLGEPDPEGPWLCRFPDAFVSALADLDDERAVTALETWAATEEIGAEPADVAHVLQGARDLARKARATGRAVHLWFSL